MITVHLRINDATTLQPTPVRLRITGPMGEYYAPFGRHLDFPTQRGEDVGGNVRIGHERFAYIDGSCEVRLPTGVPLRVRATKGPEYIPIDQVLMLGAGQMAVRLTIHRGLPSSSPWLAGDSRTHQMSPHAAALEGAAEGLQLVNLLAAAQTFLSKDANTYISTPNLIAFSGQEPALNAHGNRVFVNTLNTHRVLGRLALLNTHRVVYPLVFGDPYDTDDWSLSDWCHQCHRKKGLAIWVDAFKSGTGLAGGEALVAAILGHVDAIELDAAPRDTPLLPMIYCLWNAGVRIQLIGGSGKDSNAVPVGAYRTYALAPHGQYAEWIESIRMGMSYVTNGPLLRWDRQQASAISLSKFEKLDIVANGQTIASATVTGPTSLSLPDSDSSQTSAEAGYYQATVAFTPPEDGWYAVRCIGGHPLAFAHSSPIWVATPRVADAAAIHRIVRMVDQVREWAIERGTYSDAKWRQHLISHCDEARQRLQERLAPA